MSPSAVINVICGRDRSGRPVIRLAFRAAEAAKQINDEANQENEANAAAAVGGTAEVKTAAAEQDDKDDNQE